MRFAYPEDMMKVYKLAYPEDMMKLYKEVHAIGCRSIAQKRLTGHAHGAQQIHMKHGWI
jgi:hypothetical protein